MAHVLSEFSIKFLVKLEKNATDIYKMLQQVNRDGRMMRTQVFMQVKKFQV
jgi:hypothetical protein